MRADVERDASPTVEWGSVKGHHYFPDAGVNLFSPLSPIGDKRVAERYPALEAIEGDGSTESTKTLSETF